MKNQKLKEQLKKKPDLHRMPAKASEDRKKNVPDYLVQENALEASDSETPLTPSNMMALQKTAGNQAVGQLIQAKSKGDEPKDEIEKEADQDEAKSKRNEK